MSIEPWSKFYWSDWRGDPKLRMCSLAARGLWIEILGIMHEAVPYGYFLINSKQPTDIQLASMCGASVKDIAKLKAELQDSGVPSIDENGIWFSRRMLRDMHRKTVNRNNAKNGGNPKLKDNQKSQNRITESDNQNNTEGITASVISHGITPDTRSQKEKHPALAARPYPVDNSGGVLKNGNGGGVGVFSILTRLTESGLNSAKKAAPGWDIYNLALVYDAGVPERGVPNIPDKAFPAWCKRYTKGKQP